MSCSASVEDNSRSAPYPSKTNAECLPPEVLSCEPLLPRSQPTSPCVVPRELNVFLEEERSLSPVISVPAENALCGLAKEDSLRGTSTRRGFRAECISPLFYENNISPARDGGRGIVHSNSEKVRHSSPVIQNDCSKSSGFCKAALPPPLPNQPVSTTDSSHAPYHSPSGVAVQEVDRGSVSDESSMREEEGRRTPSGDEGHTRVGAICNPNDATSCPEEHRASLGKKELSRESLRIEIPTSTTHQVSPLQCSTFFIPQEKKVGISSPPSAMRTTAGMENGFSESHSTTTENSPIREGTATMATPLGDEDNPFFEKMFSDKHGSGEYRGNDERKRKKNSSDSIRANSNASSRHSRLFSVREGDMEQKKGLPSGVHHPRSTEDIKNHGEHKIKSSSEPSSTVAEGPRTTTAHYSGEEEDSYVYPSEVRRGEGSDTEPVEKNMQGTDAVDDRHDTEVKGTPHYSSEERMACNVHATASQRMDEVLRKTALFKGIHLRWLLIFLIFLVCALVLVFLFQFLHFTNENSLLNGRNSVFEKSASVLGNTEILIIDIVTFFVNVNRFNLSSLVLEELCTRVSNAPMAFGIYNASTLGLIHQWSCPGFGDVKLEEKIPALKTASNAAQFVDHSYRSILAYLRPTVHTMNAAERMLKKDFAEGLEPLSPSWKERQHLLPSMIQQEDEKEKLSFPLSSLMPSDHLPTASGGDKPLEYLDKVFALLLNKDQVGRLLLSTFDYRYSGATLLDTYEAFVAREWNSSDLEVFLHSLTASTPTYTSQNGSLTSQKMKKIFDQNCKKQEDVWHTVIYVASNFSLYATHHPIVEPQLEFTSSFGLLSSVTLCNVMCIRNFNTTEDFIMREETSYCSPDDPTNFWFVIRVQEFGQRYGVVITIVIGSVSVAVFSGVILIVYLSVVVPVGFIREQLFRIVGEHQNIPNWRRKFYQCSYPFWIGDISSLTSSLHVLGISFNLNKKYVPNHILRKHAHEMEVMCRKFRTGDLFDSLADPNNIRLEEEVDELEDLSDFVHLNAEPGREGGGTLATIGGSGGIGSGGGGNHHSAHRHSSQGLTFPSAPFLFSGGASMRESESGLWVEGEQEETATMPFCSSQLQGKAKRRGSSGFRLSETCRSSRAQTFQMGKDDYDLRGSPSRMESSSLIREGSDLGGLGEDEDGAENMPVARNYSHLDSQSEIQKLANERKPQVGKNVSECFSRGRMGAASHLTGSGNSSSQNSRWRRWSSSILREGGSTHAAGSGDSRSCCQPGSGGTPSAGGHPPLPNQGGASPSRGAAGGVDYISDVAELLSSPRRQGRVSPNTINPLFSSSSMVIKQTEDATILVVKLDSIDNVYLVNYEVAVRQHRRIMRYLLSRIRHWGGAVFHRSGDCLAAVWNAFDTCPNHVSRATACGMEIVGAFAVYRSLGLMVGVVVHAGMFICGIFEDAKEAFSTAFGTAARDAMMMADLVATQSTFGLIVSEPVKQATAGLYESIIVDVIKRHDDVHPIVLFELSYRRLSTPEGAAASTAVRNRQRFTIQYAKAFAHFIQHEYSDCIRLVERMRDSAPEEARPQLARIELLSYFFDTHPEEIPPLPYFRPLPSWINFEKKAWKEWLQGGKIEKTPNPDPIHASGPPSPVKNRPFVSSASKNPRGGSGSGHALLRLGRRRSLVFGSTIPCATNSVGSVSSVTSEGTSTASTTEEVSTAQLRLPEVMCALFSGSSRKNGHAHHTSSQSVTPDSHIQSASSFSSEPVRASGGASALLSNKVTSASFLAHPSSLSAFRLSVLKVLKKGQRKKRNTVLEQTTEETTSKQFTMGGGENTTASYGVLGIASTHGSILTSKGGSRYSEGTPKEEGSKNVPLITISSSHSNAHCGRVSASNHSSDKNGKEGREDSNANYMVEGMIPLHTAAGVGEQEERRHRRNYSASEKISVHASSPSPKSPQPPSTTANNATSLVDSKTGTAFSTPKTMKTPRQRIIRWSQTNSVFSEESKSPVDAALGTPGGVLRSSLSMPLPATSPVEFIQNQEKQTKAKGKGKMPSMLSFFSTPTTARHFSPPSLTNSFHHPPPHHRPIPGSKIGYSILAIFPSSPYTPANHSSTSHSDDESEQSGSQRFSSLLGIHGGRGSHPLVENEIDGGDIQGFRKDLQDNIRRHQNSTEKLSASGTGLLLTAKGGSDHSEKGSREAVNEDALLSAGTPFLSTNILDGTSPQPSFRPPPIRTTLHTSECTWPTPPHTFAPSAQSSGRSSESGTGIHSSDPGYEEKMDELGRMEDKNGVLFQRHPTMRTNGTPLMETKSSGRGNAAHSGRSLATPCASSEGRATGGGGILFSPSLSSPASHATPNGSSDGKSSGYPSHGFLSRPSSSAPPVAGMGRPPSPVPTTANPAIPSRPTSTTSLHADATAGLLTVTTFTNISPSPSSHFFGSPTTCNGRSIGPSLLPPSPKALMQDGFSSCLSHAEDRHGNESSGGTGSSISSLVRQNSSSHRKDAVGNGCTAIVGTSGNGKGTPRGTPLSSTSPSLTTSFLPPTVIPISSAPFHPNSGHCPQAPSGACPGPPSSNGTTNGGKQDGMGKGRGEDERKHLFSRPPSPSPVLSPPFSQRIQALSPASLPSVSTGELQKDEQHRQDQLLHRHKGRDRGSVGLYHDAFSPVLKTPSGAVSDGTNEKSFTSPFCRDSVMMGTDGSGRNVGSANGKSGAQDKKGISKCPKTSPRMEPVLAPRYSNLSSSADTTLPQNSTPEEGGMGLTSTNITTNGGLPCSAPVGRRGNGSSIEGGGFSEEGKKDNVVVEGTLQGAGGDFCLESDEARSTQRREEEGEKQSRNAQCEGDRCLSLESPDMDNPPSTLPDYEAAAITCSIIQSVGLTLPTINFSSAPTGGGESNGGDGNDGAPSSTNGPSPYISASGIHAGSGKHTTLADAHGPPIRQRQRSLSSMSSVPSKILAKNGILYQRSDRILGSGSFGCVYLGMDVRSGKLVAIKVLPLPTEETQGKNAEAEALIMRVKDPHVVEFISYAFQDHCIIIIMECMLAGSLHNMLMSFKALPCYTARVFIRDVLRGLNKLHSMGVIHRDVKPQNVLLSPAGNCKITDFGASAELAQQAHGNTVHGTPVYLAPEAARGAPVAVSDIWSCGIMYIQLVTGMLPYPLEKLKLPAEVLVFQIGAGIATPVIPYDQLDELEIDFITACLQPEKEKRQSASRLLQGPLFAV